MVQHNHAEGTLEYVTNAGIAADLTSYEGLGHSVNFDEICDVVAWLEALAK